MRKHLFIYASFIALTFKANLPTSGIQKTSGVDNMSEKTSTSFIENKGQICNQFQKQRKDILFAGQTDQLAFYLKENGISYQFCGKDFKKRSNASQINNRPGIANESLPPLTIYRVEMTMLGTNSNLKTEKDHLLAGYDNYYFAHYPYEALNVKRYEDITFMNIYNGINLHYYFNAKSQLEYDYILEPGADYRQIQFKINGAQKTEINAQGNLVINTPFGQLIQYKPVVKQNGQRLNARWVNENGCFKFNIENVNHSKKLIIDPVVCVRQWGTYYGGSITGGLSCANDKLGNIHMTGYTTNGILIATIGSYQSTFVQGEIAYLVKFNANGQRAWGTFYGGMNDVDHAQSCNVDKLGSIYIAGDTQQSSAAVLSTPGSHQPNPGGNKDGFLTKFSPGGYRIWSTFYGGALDDRISSCATDTLGNIFISGFTINASSTVIATPNGFQSSGTGNFLAKFDSSGTRLWGTYYANFSSSSAFCATDKTGNVFLTGATYGGTVSSGTNIATPGSFQSTYLGGNNDIYLVKFNGAGVRLWGTFYGTNWEDSPGGCATDNFGNVFLTGNVSCYSNCASFISTPGCHQPTFGGISTVDPDAFLAKFDANGARQWGTWYGGKTSDYGISCATDPQGNVYLSGFSTSTINASTATIIATPGSYQTALHNSQGLFLAKFDGQGSRIWGTYFDGQFDAYDHRYGQCSTDNFGNVYLCGSTSSSSFVATQGSQQPTIHINDNAFLVKFKECNQPAAPQNVTPASNLFICKNTSTTLSVTATGTVNWFSVPNGGTAISTGMTYNTPVLTNDTVFYVEDFNCVPSDVRTAVSVSVSLCNDFNVYGEDKTLQLFPNPNNGTFTVKSSLRSGPIRIVIFNETGQKVVDDKFNINQINSISTQLIKGFYYYNILNNSNVKINAGKLIIE